jgi:hypothetical protein
MANGRGPGSGSGTLREWASDSYDKHTGRSASSLEENGTGNRGNHTSAVSSQKSEANAGGQKGAPGVSAMDRSGSADPGRRKWGGSICP